ncbi:MAG: hypothetical protein HQL22_09585 [Candidatus Omnitrophica bacterium]|nr:hypothetical protein [Candidatus Omnitrophota bacterium]
MKEIKFKNVYSFYAQFNLKDGPHSFETLPLSEEIDKAKENGARVLRAALEIEHLLEDFIQSYLFGASYGQNGIFFNEQILKSSFFGFANKKQVYLSLIKGLNDVSGEEYSRLQEGLKNVMSYRNAFAHGEYVGFALGNIVVLRYFSGEMKEDKLSDEYWLKLLECFQKTDELIGRVRQMLPTGKGDIPEILI